MGPMPFAPAQEFYLPTPGTMVPLSPKFDPATLKGIKVHPDNPFKFDFIMDQGNNATPMNQRQPGGMASAVSPSTLPNELGSNAKAPQVNHQNDDQELRAESTKTF